jgi:hypothetical protein
MCLSSVYGAIGVECIYRAIGVERVRVRRVANLSVTHSGIMHLT